MILGRMDNKRVSSVPVSDPSSANIRSERKVTGEKRGMRNSMELSGRTLEPCCKRVKMRDIESVIQSEVMIEARRSESSISTDATNQTPPVMQHCLSNPVDRKSKSIVAKRPSSNVKASCIDANSSLSLFTQQDKDRDLRSETSRGQGFDLNTEHVSNVVDKDPLYPYKVNHPVKSREDSECGSSTGPLEENDSLRRWNEMKQNGFLSSSSSHGSIPIPKKRGRKSKSETLQKKIEIAKKEEINRFTKAAAPSGLLTGLNPGIITHVRNSKQVHSIIEALVRSEKSENGSRSRLAGGELIRETKDTKDQRNDVHNLEARPFCLSHESELPNTIKGNKDEIYFAYRRVCGDTSVTSNFSTGSEDDMLTLKLASSLTMPSETRSSVTTEDSASQASITSLSVKAATVASQWLELLYQDIKGRLAALERSKKRLQSVIQTELPLLISREFSPEQENSSYSSKSSTGECFNTANSDIHRTRWSALFGQMEKTLSEEGKALECWLNQVKEAQLHCEWGLQCVNWHDFQLIKSEDDSRLKKAGRPEKEQSLMAAAASIYSTCTSVMTNENVFCF